MTRTPALLAWTRPRSARDLERFWRRAARWCGVSDHVDRALVRLRECLDQAAGHRWPRAYHAAMLRQARKQAYHTWRLLSEGHGLISRDGHPTALGREMEREIRRAAGIDGGLGTGRSRDERVLPMGRTIPEAQDYTLDTYGLWSLEPTVPPYGEGHEFDPMPCDGFEALGEGGHV